MNNKEKEQSLALADHYFKSNNYPFAEAILKKVIELDPQSSKANELLAYIYGNQGKEELAHNLLSKACSSTEASAEAYYYLGSSFIKLSEFEKAKKSLKKALEKAGDFFEGLHDLGTTYARLGNNSKSLKYFLKALKLRNNSHELLFNIGRAYDDLRDFEKAIQYYDQAIKINPNLQDALSNCGVALNELNRHTEALSFHEKVIQLNASYAEGWNNAGGSLHKLKRYSEAIAHYERAILLKPEYLEAIVNKGISLKCLMRHTEAIEQFNQALKINPLYSKALSQKALALGDLKEFKSALENHDAAIQLTPENSEILCNKAITLSDLRRLDEAISILDKSIELNPHNSDAKNNKALINLSLQKFEAGWESFSARLDVSCFSFPLDPSICQIWNGLETCNNLLIVGEQGIGDEIFYSSFLKKVLNKAIKISMLTDKRLVPIFSRSFPAITFLEKNSSIDHNYFDAQIPIGNLPIILKSNPLTDKIPRIPFITDNQEVTQGIRKDPAFKKGFTCGIAWKSANKKLGADKSINLSALKEILQTPNCKFINLQYGDVDDDIKHANELNGIEISSVKNIDPFENIDGLLSTIKACDIVITTSNVTAHLAGCIGKKTLMLTPYSQGKIWYWHDDPQNIWYPSIQQFFQSNDFDWSEAIKNVAKELKKEIDGKN